MALEARVHDADDERFRESRVGRSQRDKEMIEKLLRSGKTPEEIYDFCGYPMKLILEVQNEMLVAQ